MSLNAHGSSEKVFVIGSPAVEAIHIAGPVLKDAYSQLGITARFEQIPNQRLFKMMEYEQIDGDLARIENTFDDNEHYIKVPVPLVKFSMHLFCAHHIPTCSNDILNDASLTIGLTNGQSALRAMLSSTKIAKLDDINVNTLPLLEQGKVDAIVGMKLETGELVWASDEYPSATTPLREGEAFHYLNKKNKHLLKPLTEALKKRVAQYR